MRRSSAEQCREEAARQLSQKTQQDSNVVSQLKAIVADREAKVKVLEQELLQLRNNHMQVGGREVGGRWEGDGRVVGGRWEVGGRVMGGAAGG